MSEIAIEIIVYICLVLLIGLVFLLGYRANKREERKNPPEKDGLVRTRTAKWVKVLLIVLMVLVAVAAIIVSIGAAIDGEFGVSIGVAVGFFLFDALMFVLYTYSKLCYEVVTDDRIILVRAFGRKRKEYIFGKDVGYYGFISTGFAPTLVIYDAYGVPLARISQMSIGASAITEKLLKAGIPLVPEYFPPKDARKTEHYKQHRKRLIRKVCLGVLYGWGICMTLLFVVMWFCNPPIPDYENTEIKGSVESVKYAGDTVEIKLVGDDGVYYVNNIVYGVFDAETFGSWFTGKDEIVEGEITLLVAYTDGNGRKNLCGTEFYGHTVLDAAEAEKIEREEYRNTLIVGIAFGVFGVSSFVAAVVLSVVFARKPFPPLPDEPLPPSLRVSENVSPFE